MSEYPYEEDLRQALSNFRDARSKKNEAEKKEQELKDQIKEWMNLVGEDYVEVEDDTGQLWKIQWNERSSLKVADWDALYEELGDKFYTHIKSSKSYPFIVQEKKK